MSKLISENPKSTSRAELSAVESSSAQLEAPYNRSSLALDFDNASFPMRQQPMPQLVTNRYAAAGVGAVPDVRIWKGFEPLQFKKDRTSSAVSFIVHGVVVTGILWWGVTAHTNVVQTANTLVTPMELFDPPPPKVMPVARVMGGGGGGGAHQIVEPTQGQPPKIARIQTLPPQIVRVNNPKLAVEPTAQIKMPDNSNMPNLGASDSPQVALASQGRGSNSGFGHGLGGGIGSGQGSGAGAGAGGGYGGGLMSVGGGVSAPQVLHSAQPEFTEEARRADYQGTVAIQLIVDAQGNPQNVRVVRHLGMGLDDKAVEAVRQYRFRPAMYQGHPVAVQMVIEVDFHLH
jgi:TonB family protein